MKLWPRICDITGEGMDCGYCIDEGRMYIKHHANMIKHVREVTGDSESSDDKLLEDAYNNDYYYYTDWECPDDIQYVEVDGVMYGEGEPEYNKYYLNK